MKVTEKEVAYISSLARLQLGEDETRTMAAHMSRILEYIEKLNSVNTSTARSTFHAMEKTNAFRDDEVQESLPTQEALRNSPAPHSDFFIVPKVL